MTGIAVDTAGFISVSAAARQAHVADETIRHWYDAGELTGRRSARGHRLIDPASLQRRLACVGVADAAQILGRSEQHIRALFDSGVLDGYRTSRGWRRIAVASLNEMLGNRKPK